MRQCRPCELRPCHHRAPACSPTRFDFDAPRHDASCIRSSCWTAAVTFVVFGAQARGSCLRATRVLNELQGPHRRLKDRSAAPYLAAVRGRFIALIIRSWPRRSMEPPAQKRRAVQGNRVASKDVVALLCSRVLVVKSIGRLKYRFGGRCG